MPPLPPQADLADTRQQRDDLAAESSRLAGELRDCIYSLSAAVAQQQGQLVSWALRGLQSCGTQTEYCRLWEANLCHGSTHSTGQDAGSKGATGPESSASAGGSVLCPAVQDRSFGEGSEDEACSGVEAGSGQLEAAPPPRALSLPALQRQIQSIYRAKAVHDIAVARGQRPFLPLADFLAAHLSLQAGAHGPAVRQRAAQLQASVEAHAGADREVALFGLAAGMLEEAEEHTVRVDCCAPLMLQPAAAGCSVSGSAGAAVPLILYHSRRIDGTAVQRALPTLRRFGAAAWHVAYLRSAARPPLAQPFDPFEGSRPLLHPMAAEVHAQAVVTPGVEPLMSWVLGGGLGACIDGLDLGLRLAENQVGKGSVSPGTQQAARHESRRAPLTRGVPPPVATSPLQVPQLYLLVVEAARLLGLRTAPQLYVRSSGEAAAHYLLLPASARLHGLNGGAPPQPPQQQQPAPAAAAEVEEPEETRGLRLLEPGSCRVRGEGIGTAQAQEWQCAVVLTSALVDLLEPDELQATVAGCLGLHAALVCPAASAGLDLSSSDQGAAQRAVACRSPAALASLAALSSLAPEALAQRLPHAMGPFFHSRIQPALRRSARYLQLYCDRVAAAAAGSWRPVASAAVKQAAGCAVLRGELNLGAVLEQARALDAAATELLPAAVQREERATVAGATSSLTLLRVRELQRWAEGTPSDSSKPAALA